MIQIISKDNKIICKTTAPYPPQTIRELKKAGYKIKEIIEQPDDLKEKENNNA